MDWPLTRDLLHITALARRISPPAHLVSTGVLWAVELEKLVRRRVTARST
jgi:hypothetical protein